MLVLQSRAACVRGRSGRSWLWLPMCWRRRPLKPVLAATPRLDIQLQKKTQQQNSSIAVMQQVTASCSYRVRYQCRVLSATPDQQHRWHQFSVDGARTRLRLLRPTLRDRHRARMTSQQIEPATCESVSGPASALSYSLERLALAFQGRILLEGRC